MTDPRLLAVDPPEPAGPPTRRSPRRIVIAGVLILAAGVVAVTTFLPRWLTTPDESAPSAAAPAAATVEGRRIQAALFYLSESGTSLAETRRSVLYGDTQALQVRHLVEAQIARAPEGLINPVPDGTVLRAAFVTEAHEAYVDLGGAIAQGHSGGSLSEALTVYAIVNTITSNLPDITAVQILINGQEVDSLAGHIDLRAPLAQSLDWVDGHERTARSDDTH